MVTTKSAAWMLVVANGREHQIRRARVLNGEGASEGATGGSNVRQNLCGPPSQAWYLLGNGHAVAEHGNCGHGHVVIRDGAGGCIVVATENAGLSLMARMTVSSGSSTLSAVGFIVMLAEDWPAGNDNRADAKFVYCGSCEHIIGGDLCRARDFEFYFLLRSGRTPRASEGVN